MTELDILNHIETGNGIFDQKNVPALEQSALEDADRKIDVLLRYGYIERPPGGILGEPILRMFGDARNPRLLRVDVIYGLTQAGKQRLAYLARGGTSPS